MMVSDAMLQGWDYHAEVSKLRSPGEFREKILSPAPRHESAPGLPWSWTREKFRFRAGETTVWTGGNFAGKSLMIGQVALWSMEAEPWLIGSYEMSPVDTLERMIRQAAGTEHPSDEFKAWWLDWAEGKLWLHDHFGEVATAQVLAVANYGATELGVKHVAVDSLMKVGIRSDDYNEQKRFLNQFIGLCREKGIHGHMVAHQRKPQSDQRGLMDRYAIHGAHEISSQADNVLIAWRNAEKESLVEDGVEVVRVRGKEVPVADLPDAVLRVDKQRNGAWVGKINLWFHPSGQFLSKRTTTPMMWHSEWSVG